MAKKQSEQVVPKDLKLAERRQIMRNFFMGEAARRAAKEGKEFNPDEWVKGMMEKRFKTER